jgi:putative flavoprotein involved in K+ transport
MGASTSFSSAGGSASGGGPSVGIHCGSSSPNWSLELPGFRYSGDDPDGFAHFTEVGRTIDEYARGRKSVVRENTEVVALADRDDHRGFILTLHDGFVKANRVIIATGPFQRPLIPQFAYGIPHSVYQTDPTRYRTPADLSPGAVLVVGSGASGYQIADELHHAGRRVYLSVSRHRRVPRRFRGKDVFWWLERMGRFSQTSTPSPTANGRHRRLSLGSTAATT